MKTRLQLIRSASRKELTASQWRKRMEAWMDMEYAITIPLDLLVYDGDFGSIQLIRGDRFTS